MGEDLDKKKEVKEELSKSRKQVCNNYYCNAMNYIIFNT